MDSIVIFLIIFLIIALALLVLFARGVIKTFQRQPVVAILMVIFLFPLYICWVIIEAVFTDPID